MSTHSVAYGRIVDARGETLDRVLLTVMRGPNTSTGEDTVEISCHGGRWVSARVLDRILESGARPAEAGEFTRRAFLNGRIDLVQAEGVLEVVRARTDEGLRAALRQVEGDVSRAFEVVRGKLDECRVRMECAIEFPEEGLSSDEGIREMLEETAAELGTMLESARAGRRLQDGTDVAILGKPNVGKSTLFNDLVEEDRVLVSPEPGTTRDVVAEWAVFGGVPVRLLDTAGLRAGTCDIEMAAVERARRAGAGAETVLYLLDASRPPDVEDRAALANCRPASGLVVLNKIDLGVCEEVEQLVSELDAGIAAVRISALTGEGIATLREEISRLVGGGGRWEGGITASMRQIDTLTRTYDYINKSMSIMDSEEGIELAAAELRDAVDTFGEITGATPTEEILDRIFSRFCIGK